MLHKVIIGGLTLALLIPGLYTSVFAKAETYKIDPVHSSVVFRAGHFGISRVFGRINELSGTVVMDEDNLANCSLVIELNPASVDSNNADRDKHLRGPDFFNVKQFPVWKFSSTSVQKSSDGSFSVTGEMLLHGVKKSITVKIEKLGEGQDPWGGYRAGWYSEFSIKRSEFGMDYMLEGLSDEIKVYLALEGIRQ